MLIVNDLTLDTARALLTHVTHHEDRIGMKAEYEGETFTVGVTPFLLGQFIQWEKTSENLPHNAVSVFTIDGELRQCECIMDFKKAQMQLTPLPRLPAHVTPKKLN